MDNNQLPEITNDVVLEDTEGHKSYAGSAFTDDDTEGHRSGHNSLTDDEDLEGHKSGHNSLTDDEDLEGHINFPRPDGPPPTF